MRIWIINHYAMRMYEEGSGRHYYLAKYLIDNGQQVTIITSSFNHFLKKTNRIKYEFKNNVPFFFLNGLKYKTNGINRYFDLIVFPIQLIFSLRLKKLEKPDIIIASSPQLLSILGAKYLSKRYSAPLLSEYRDLWPESLVAYGVAKKSSFTIKILYLIEEYTYKTSNHIIMTWEGGIDYLRSNPKYRNLDYNKVHYVSNVVSLEDFDSNLLDHEEHYRNDFILDEETVFTYTGSISKVNDLKMLVDAFYILFKKKVPVKLLIYGEGTHREELVEFITQNKILNVIYKGAISKSNIPNVLRTSDINVLHNKSTILDQYGQSQNKLFDYLAAGRPVLQTYRNNYSVIEKHNAGYIIQKQSINSIVSMIEHIINDRSNYSKFGKNARIASKHYDYMNVFKTYSLIIKEVISKRF